MISDTIKSDYQLDQYAASVADDIAAEIKEHGGDAYDLAHQAADGSEHVIYYSNAHAVCQNCDITAGECELSTNWGEPIGGWTYNDLATAIAYGELHHRILVALDEKGVE